MFKKILQFLIAVVGVFLGYSLADFLIQTNLFVLPDGIIKYIYYGVITIIFGLILYIFAPRIIGIIEKSMEKIEAFISKHPRENLIIGFFGIIVGIIISFIISLPLSMIRTNSSFIQILITIVSVILYISFATLFYRISIRNRADIMRFIGLKRNKKINLETNEIKDQNKPNLKQSIDKLLDTSVLIDGRIEQIAKTGFIDGKLIIPNFVLEELQLIADSSDDLKRERGRRGLDIVNDLMKNELVEVVNTDFDYPNIKEVDIKLLKYSNDKGCSIITNDFNLNKLANVQGIKVLNINDLANAVKTVVIPGERMLVNIIKEGKERSQGLAYLDDGTMIVIEEGKDYIGENIEVVVSKVLQTAAGKMIFTKIIN